MPLPRAACWFSGGSGRARSDRTRAQGSGRLSFGPARFGRYKNRASPRPGPQICNAWRSPRLRPPPPLPRPIAAPKSPPVIAGEPPRPDAGGSRSLLRASLLTARPSRPSRGLLLVGSSRRGIWHVTRGEGDETTRSRRGRMRRRRGVDSLTGFRD
jgi:hypothetical protein